MRAQVLDGQVPGDVVVDVFFDLLRRVETADLEHPLVIDMADAGVEDAAGRLDVRGRIVPVLVIELAAGLFADAELGGVGGDGLKFLLRAVGHHADADKRDDDALVIQGSQILRQPRMTSVEQGLARAAADLHVRRVTAVAAALKLRVLARTQAQRVELDGRGGAFFIIGVENAELQPRQCVEVVQQLRQACVFEVKHTAAVLLKRVVNL